MATRLDDLVTPQLGINGLPLNNRITGNDITITPQMAQQIRLVDSSGNHTNNNLSQTIIPQNVSGLYDQFLRTGQLGNDNNFLSNNFLTRGLAGLINTQNNLESGNTQAIRNQFSQIGQNIASYLPVSNANTQVAPVATSLVDPQNAINSFISRTNNVNPNNVNNTNTNRNSGGLNALMPSNNRTINYNLADVLNGNLTSIQPQSNNSVSNNNYTPIIDNSIFNQRDQRLSQLQSLMDQYNSLAPDGNQSPGDFLVNRARRGAVLNQMNTIRDLLNNTNSLSQDYINNLNSNNLTDIRSLRDNDLAERRLGTDIANTESLIGSRNISNALAINNNQRTNEQSDIQNALLRNQLNESNNTTQARQRLSDLLNTTPTLSREQATQYSNTPEFKVAVDQNIRSGMNAQQAQEKALSDYASVIAQTIVLNQLRNNQILNGTYTPPKSDTTEFTAKDGNIEIKGTDLMKVLSSQETAQKFLERLNDPKNKDRVLIQNGQIVKN